MITIPFEQWRGRPLPPPAPLPPPPAPLSPSSLLGAVRALRTQNFPLLPCLPFFLPSPSSRPLLSTPLFSLLPPPHLPPPAPSFPTSLLPCPPPQQWTETDNAIVSQPSYMSPPDPGCETPFQYMWNRQKHSTLNMTLNVTFTKWCVYLFTFNTSLVNVRHVIS